MIGNQVLTRGNRGIFLLALFFGLVFAILTYVFFSNVADDGGGQISGLTKPVVVAAQNVPAGTRITADMVEVKFIPEGLVLSNIFSDTEAVVGQVSAVPLTAGEQIVAGRVSASGIDLAQFGDNPPLAVVIPEGMRGVSIQVSEVAASGGLIQPGDYVDVLIGFLPVVPETAAATTSVTQGAACYVLQDVQVLAISQDVTRPSQGETSGAATSPLAGSNPNPAAASATLAVTPVQAWQVTAAHENTSQLWLSLRPFGERGSVTGLPQCTLQGS
jgi:Flp pilus assembly protein CpaB